MEEVLTRFKAIDNTTNFSGFRLNFLTSSQISLHLMNRKLDSFQYCNIVYDSITVSGYELFEIEFKQQPKIWVFPGL